MHLTAREIAGMANGQLDGDPEAIVTGVAGIREARPGELSFVAHPKYYSALAATRAAVVLVGADCPAAPGHTVVRVDNPLAAFTKIVEQFVPPPPQFAPGVHPAAVVAGSAQLGRDVSIQPGAVIESEAVVGDRTVIGAGAYVGHTCQVGADCLLYPRVTLRDRTVLGDRVILHPGVVLGADGFGFEDVRGERKKIAQVVTVEIGDDVEIGANSCVDRGRFGVTSVGKGTKIDNLVQVGHNCQIGEHCIICASVGIAGSVLVGNHVTIAGQVGIAGHLAIGDQAILGAQAGVTKDVPARTLMLGAPAEPHMKFKRVNAAIRRLPEMATKLRQLEKLLAELQQAGPPAAKPGQ
ncbi:UDP-3-O-(3-hydroxymyristoyl)glucosamine N-acyltransferase [bacterium]|nr:UDP-3-O-(3-hydroxymyristoyl)glucosamine N-acyltransferase [bacterium]